MEFNIGKYTMLIMKKRNNGRNRVTKSGKHLGEKNLGTWKYSKWTL